MHNKGLLPIYTNSGDKIWRNKDGKLHRLDGPALESKDGSKAWYQDGLLHRIGGPAIEVFTGDKQWYKNGKRHRVDGPAIEWNNGVNEWWLNGKSFSSKEGFFDELTDEEKSIALFSDAFINGTFTVIYRYFDIGLDDI